MVLAAFIISIFALAVALMALPTVAEMIWGKPNIKIAFDSYKNNDNCTVIRCKVFNLPIENWCLKQMGVYRRAAEDVVARYKIVDQANESLIVDEIPYFQAGWGGGFAQRISLPVSKYPATFSVFSFSPSGEFAYYSKRKPQKMSIRLGVYGMRVSVEVGNKLYDGMRLFHVLESQPFCVFPTEVNHMAEHQRRKKDKSN